MPKKPADFQTGDVITAERLNRIRDHGIASLRVGPGLRMHTDANGNTTVFLANNIPPRMAGGGTPSRMRIKERFNDYLRCRKWDGTTEGEVDIYVAKPYKLRHDETHYPNVTAIATTGTSAVTATVNGTDESWVLPSEVDYDIDAEIYAIGVGATGVLQGAEPITWIDLNIDGRHWIIDE